MSKDFQYFKDNFETLCENFDGKFIVIKNQNVICVANSYQEAVKEALKTEKLGTFIVQQCGAGPECYTQVYQSNVVFNTTNEGI